MRVPAPLVLTTLLLACGPPAETPPAPPADPDVLAVWDGGEVTVTDLDAHLVARPGQRRPGPGVSTAAWLEGQIEKLVADASLRTDDSSADVEADPLYAEAFAERRREMLHRAFVGSRNAQFEITLDEARASFERHREGYRQPERRALQNLLLATPPGATEAEVEARCAEAAELRERAMAGASFEALVVEHSDAANAVAGGMIGGVTRDQLRPDLAQVVFGLEPGVVSEVVRNAAGCHLFLVLTVQPEIEPTFGLLQDRIVEELAAARREEMRLELLREQALLLGVELPPFLDGPVPADLPADSELFAFGDVRITLRDLAAAVGPGDDPRAVLLRMMSGPVFAAAFEREAPAEVPALEARAREEVIDQLLYGRAMREHLLSLSEEALRREYDGARDRYHTDVQVELAVYQWPIGPGDPLRFLEAPRAFAAALTDGEDPETAWAAHGDAEGTRRSIVPLSSVRELSQRRPDLAHALIRLEGQGQVIEPFRVGPQIAVVQVTTYVPSRPLSFLEARERIREEYGRDRGATVLDEWARATAEEHGLVVFPERLEAFGSRLVEHLTGGAS